MSSPTVARRYAKALADALLGQEARVVQEELIGWELMIRSTPQLQEAFENPTIPYHEKQKVLQELIGRTKVRPPTANFLQILLKNHRLSDLGEINVKFAEVLDAGEGLVAAHVTTARPISDEIKGILMEKLSKITGKTVRLNLTIDQSLIGGVVTRVGSTVYDGSIRGQLDRMKMVLAGPQ